jgi:hypothetical protein
MKITYDSTKTKYEEERIKANKKNAVISVLLILFIFIILALIISSTVDDLFLKIIPSSIIFGFAVIFYLGIVYKSYLGNLKGFKIYDKYIFFPHNNEKIEFSSIINIHYLKNDIILELESSKSGNRKKRYLITENSFPRQDRSKLIKTLKTKIKNK